jgi:uncharacterized phage infection (PIP) family protein YhgE
MGRLSTVTAVKDYDKLLKENSGELDNLEERAAVFLEHLETYETAEDHLVELERQNAELHADRESLRADYADAIFENEPNEIERIHAARESLDNDIAQVFEGIEEVTAWVENNAPDVQGMSEVVAAEGLLPQLSLYSVIEQLRAAHSENMRDMQSRRVPLSRSLNEYLDDVDIEAAKRRLSDTYKATQEAQEARRNEQIAWEATVENLPPSVRNRPIYQQRQYAELHGL